MPVPVLVPAPGGPGLLRLHPSALARPPTPPTPPLPLPLQLRKASPDAILSHMVVLLCSLDALHNCAGIIHGDLKPDNVVRAPDSLLKLVDFGCAAALDPRGQQQCGPEGSMAFMAPEKMFEGRDGAAADMWVAGPLGPPGRRLPGWHPVQPRGPLPPASPELRPLHPPNPPTQPPHPAPRSYSLGGIFYQLVFGYDTFPYCPPERFGRCYASQEEAVADWQQALASCEFIVQPAAHLPEQHMPVRGCGNRCFGVRSSAGERSGQARAACCLPADVLARPPDAPRRRCWRCCAACWPRSPPSAGASTSAPARLPSATSCWRRWAATCASCARTWTTSG